jgi:hypothetical protein
MVILQHNSQYLSLLFQFESVITAELMSGQYNLQQLKVGNLCHITYLFLLDKFKFYH